MHYNTNNSRTTQITTNLEECRLCPVFASFTLAFALQLRKKHGKTSVALAFKISLLIPCQMPVTMSSTVFLDVTMSI
jgi:Na+/glutamate symporter